MANNRVGESFTLVCVTRAGGCHPWRELTGRWRFTHQWSYIEIAGQSDITQGRSEAMSRWLLDTRTAWSVWLDDDMWLSWEGLMAFCESALDRADDVDFLSGVYVPKIKGSAKFTTLFRDPEVTLGIGGDVVPLQGCGFGCVAVKRELCLRIAEHLPRVRYTQTNHPGWPFFMSMVVPAPEDEECPYRHAGEDYAFCSRALQAGGRLYADTRLRLGHEGSYIYNWEDAAQVVELVETLKTRRVHAPFYLDPDAGPPPPPPKDGSGEPTIAAAAPPTCVECRRFTQSALEARGTCTHSNGWRDCPRPDGPTCSDFLPRSRKHT